MHTGHLRKMGRSVGNLYGDWLPYVGLSFEHKQMLRLASSFNFASLLRELVVEGGETTTVLGRQIDWRPGSKWNGPERVLNTCFLRWPRDVEYNPVKVTIPLFMTNGHMSPQVKAGGYVHNRFEWCFGIPCRVHTRRFPTHFICDMAKARRGQDYHWEDLKAEYGGLEGVVPIDHACTRTFKGDFLILRALRIRGH